ncbi:MAG: hypothetical protein KJ811_01255, partial [Candidatus Margulisbacteria bacterium]|nr:hypothetical protein [Candidatus Margulisiibacteriota bacterium]
MQISQVGSMADLARLYQVRDTDGSGKLEAGEVPEEQVSSYDRDGDNGLSPWEVMEARGRQVFTLEQVESARNEEESITEAENPTIISSLVLLASSRIAGPLIVLSMIFTSSGCVSYQGNPSRFSNGQVFTGQLANNALVDGIRYRSGTLLMFHENGQVMQGTLAEGTRIQGFYFPAGTRITFTSAGRLEQVNTRSQPFLVQILSGGSFLWVSLRGIIRFHGNRSAILSARLARNTTIGGVLYRGGSEILLSEYGSFLGGTLVNDSEIRGIRYRQNTSISYHGNGRVRSGKLLENTSIRNVLFGGDDWQRNINFYANGQVRSGHLAENATIEGRSYRAGTHIMFHDNG